MNKFRILIIILSVVIFSSCEENENDNFNGNENEIVNFWPLKVGNYWAFVDSSNYSDTWRVDTVTWFVSEKITSNGKEFYSISITNDYPQSTNQTKWLFRIEDNNVISAGGTTPSDTLIAESVLIKDTEIIGESWPYYHVVSSEGAELYVKDTIDMTLDAIDELNNTIYGLLDYKAYSYSFNVEQDERTSTFYVSNNIGPIRITGKKNDKIIKISELIEYDIE